MEDQSLKLKKVKRKKIESKDFGGKYFSEPLNFSGQDTKNHFDPKTS